MSLPSTTRSPNATRERSIAVTLSRTEAPEKGYPYFVEYIWAWPGAPKVTQNQLIATSRGYAAIAYDPNQCAADNSTFTGAYYTLYPYYTKNPSDKTGVLLAWAWGVSKIIDAMEMGAITNPYSSGTAAVKVLDKAAQYCQSNVSPAAVCGWLNWALR